MGTVSVKQTLSGSVSNKQTLSLALWMVDDIFFCRFGVLKMTRLQFGLVYLGDHATSTASSSARKSFSCRSESSNKSLVVLGFETFNPYHMWPDGAWRETCEEYWKAGCSLRI